MKVILLIGAYDPSGVEGVIPSLRTIQTYRGLGIAVITTILAQNTKNARGVWPIPLEHVGAQLQATFEEIRIDGCYVAHLPNLHIAKLVADTLKKNPPRVTVVDTICATAHGLRFHDAEQLKDLVSLFDMPNVIYTMNLEEASLLADMEVTKLSDMKDAAKVVYDRYKPLSVIVKGGHLPDNMRAFDVVFDGKMNYVLDQNRVKKGAFIGVGDVFGALVTYQLAEGKLPPQAVERAKRFIIRALQFNIQLPFPEGFLPLHTNIPVV